MTLICDSRRRKTAAIPFIAAAALAGAAWQGAGGQAPEHSWLTDRAFERQLQSVVPVARWNGTPLREALESLARAHRVALLLDRRVDPGRPLRVEVKGQTLEATLERIAESQGLETAVLDNVVYFGPPETARVLPAAARPRSGEPSAASPLAWPELATPRQLLADLAAEAGLDFPPAEQAQVPHDLWPSVDLPPQRWGQRVSLVLAGFGLGYQVAAKQFRLAALPESGAYTRTYRVTAAEAKKIQQTAQQDDQARVAAGRGQAQVTGSAKLHRRIAAALSVPAKAAGESRLTLRVQNKPAEAVLRKITQDLGLELQIAAEASEPLKSLVSFTVEEATLEELFQAVAEAAGVSAVIRDKVVIVGAK